MISKSNPWKFWCLACITSGGTEQPLVQGTACVLVCTLQVNQILGLDDLTRKQVLALLSHNLSFIPKTFKMPEEYDAWQK
jgi:hypothetical protein